MKTKGRAFVVDTETTGQREGMQVIELAYAPLHVTDGPVRYGTIFYSRYKPTLDITPEAMACHNILAEDLAECPPSSEAVLPESAEFIVAHNADYDWEALGKPNVKRICTLALARKYFPGGGHKLAQMMYRILPPKEARKFVTGSHCAKDDLRCCALLLSAIVDRIGPENVTTWEGLWEVCELAREPDVWTFGKHRDERIDDTPKGYIRWAIDNLTNPDPYLVRKLRRILGEPLECTQTLEPSQSS